MYKSKESCSRVLCFLSIKIIINCNHTDIDTNFVLTKNRKFTTPKIFESTMDKEFNNVQAIKRNASMGQEELSHRRINLYEWSLESWNVRLLIQSILRKKFRLVEYVAEAVRNFTKFFFSMGKGQVPLFLTFNSSYTFFFHFFGTFAKNVFLVESPANFVTQ